MLTFGKSEEIQALLLPFCNYSVKLFQNKKTCFLYGTFCDFVILSLLCPVVQFCSFLHVDLDIFGAIYS